MTGGIFDPYPTSDGSGITIHPAPQRVYSYLQPVSLHGYEISTSPLLETHFQNSCIRPRMQLRGLCFFVLIVLVLAGVALLYAPQSKIVPEYGLGELDSTLQQHAWPCSPNFREPYLKINDSLITSLLDTEQLPIKNVHKLASRRRLFQSSWGAMVVWNSTVQLNLVSTYPPKAFNVGLVVTAIGKYTRFMPKLFETADRYFLPSQNVTYVIFTDKTAEVQAINSIRPKLTFNEFNLGWPRNTMMRFAFILKHGESLKQFDFLYTLDADSLFRVAVDSEILSFRVGALHAYYFYKTRRPFSYDTNPYSTAYVNIAVEGEYYFYGGLFGGCTQEILRMSSTIQKNIERDLEINYLALWHDESHVNR